MYLTSFPQLSNPAYDSKTFLKRFNEENTIIHATCGEVSYAEHAANLSFKLALSGKEYYQVSNVPISVNDQSFLILNHGQRYASWIEPGAKVESFSVFFTKEFASDVLTNLLLPEDILVDTPAQELQPVLFFEKLYPLEGSVIQLVMRLNHILKAGQKADDMQVEQTLHAMLGYLIETHRGERKKVETIGALKLSTRVEIYKRLSRATDYINTCFTEPITLKQLSTICCLSENHLLRHFKKTFHVSQSQVFFV